MPILKRIPVDYESETSYTARSHSRTSSDGAWQDTRLTPIRKEKVLSSSGDVLFIGGDFEWVTDDGVLQYANTGLYGVDRTTRRNVNGFGDVARSGQYLFPQSVERTTYKYWDPGFIGQRTATFEKDDVVNGLPVYVFTFVAHALDGSEGYSFLPDIPEKYRAISEGSGELWIEPVTGRVVDFAEHGLSYFADPESGKRVADFYLWEDRLTASSRAVQVEAARREKLRLRMAGMWIPAAFLAFCGLSFVYLRKRLHVPHWPVEAK